MRMLRSSLRLSISTRLTLWFGLSLLFLLSLFVVFLYSSFHVGLHHDFEDQLHHDEAHLRNAVRIEGVRPVLQVDAIVRSVAYQTDGPSGTYVRLLSPEGTSLYRSPNFEGHMPFAPAHPDAVATTEVSHTWQDVPARSRYVPLTDARGHQVGWLEVTRLESALHRELHRLRGLLVLGILLGVALAIGSGYGLARRALHPVATITEAARTIPAGYPGKRLPTDFGVRDELTDLAETLNDLLMRLDASFERERRFRADAAHEMFTPLSALQSELEVTLRKKRAPDDYEQTLRRLLDHARRLAGIVDDLLLLSRVEAFRQAEPARTALGALVQARVSHFRAVAEDRDIDLRHRVIGDADHMFVSAAAGPLETVLDNLIDNAIKYTEAGGTVTVTVDVQDTEVAVAVEDTGIGFDATEQTQLFDRFYRSTRPSVQRERGGGLGLSIARAIVDGFGGYLDAYSEGVGQGSRFVLFLPRHQSHMRVYPVPAPYGTD